MLRQGAGPEAFEWYRVDRDVGNVRNQGPHLIEPLPLLSSKTSGKPRGAGGILDIHPDISPALCTSRSTSGCDSTWPPSTTPPTSMATRSAGGASSCRRQMNYYALA